MNRICSYCNSTKTYIGRNGNGIFYEDWRKDKNRNIMCKKCWSRIIYDPVVNPLNRKKYNPRRILFLGKIILLGWNPKKGFCSKCLDNKKTDMHHYFYVPCMVWACTEELCGVCHSRTTWRLGQHGKIHRQMLLKRYNPRTGKLRKNTAKIYY